MIPKSANPDLSEVCLPHRFYFLEKMSALPIFFIFPFPSLTLILIHKRLWCSYANSGDASICQTLWFVQGLTPHSKWKLKRLSRLGLSMSDAIRLFKRRDLAKQIKQVNPSWLWWGHPTLLSIELKEKSFKSCVCCTVRKSGHSDYCLSNSIMGLEISAFSYPCYRFNGG